MTKDEKDDDKPGNAVSLIRQQLRRMTQDILSKNQNLPQSQGSTKATKTEWDEICLGVWIQDTSARQKKQPGRCLGLSIIKTKDPNGNFDENSVSRNRALSIVVSEVPIPPPNSWAAQSPPAAASPSNQAEDALKRIEKALAKQYDYLTRVFDHERAGKVFDFGHKIMSHTYRATSSLLEKQIEGLKRWIGGDKD